MPSPREPVKHHFIAAFYIAGWAANDGLVVQYSKVHGGLVKPKRVHPKATGFQRGLYSTKNSNFETSHFAPIDQAGSDAIAYLRNRSGIVNLPDRLLSGLVSFVASLMARSPAAIRKEINALRDMIASQNDPFEIEYDTERPEGSPTYKEAMHDAAPDIHFNALQTIEREGGLVRDALRTLRFAVLEIPEDMPRLVTSDYPGFFELLTSPKARLYLPLCKRKLLLGFRDYSIYFSEAGKVRHGLSQDINQLVCGAAERFVYSIGCEELPYIQANLGTMPHIRFDALLD
jgi:hypothetical protein